jgi:hypothetical protein
LEFGVPKLRHLETYVEVEPWGRGQSLRDWNTYPIVFTGLLGLGNDAKTLDHYRRDSFLFQKSFQKSSMVHNVSRDVVQLDT